MIHMFVSILSTCPSLLLRGSRRKHQRSYVANTLHLTTEVPLLVDKVKPCLFQPENRCRAKTKRTFQSPDCRQTVWNVHAHVFWKACITNKPPLRLHPVVFSIDMFVFIVPVRWAICSEVWNCNKQGFTVCPHSVSAGGEQFFFVIAHAGLLSFHWTVNENTCCLFWRAALVRGTIFRCHQTALCHFLFLLLPDSVTDPICSTLRLFVVHLLQH